MLCKKKSHFCRQKCTTYENFSKSFLRWSSVHVEKRKTLYLREWALCLSILRAQTNCEGMILHTLVAPFGQLFVLKRRERNWDSLRIKIPYQNELLFPMEIALKNTTFRRYIWMGQYYREIIETSVEACSYRGMITM